MGKTSLLMGAPIIYFFKGNPDYYKG
jgi:hypothetical protein